MGIVTCSGQLALNPLTVRTATAVAKGKISDRDPPPQKSTSKNQFILSIYYPEYYARQRQYLDLGCPELLREPLRSFGMTDEGIAYLEETGQVRSMVRHGCPSRFRVTYIAERGAEVARGDLLFKYGEATIMAGLPKRVVQHLEPGTPAHACPENWPTGTSEGRKMFVRVAHVGTGSLSDHVVYFSVMGTCPDYMIGAPFNLQIDVPALPDGPAIVDERKPADKSVRPDTWLPPRGAAGNFLTLHKQNKYKANLAPTRTDALRHSISTRVQPDPIPLLIKNGGYKPAVAPGHPPVATVASGSKSGSAAGDVAASAVVRFDDDGQRSRRKSGRTTTKP